MAYQNYNRKSYNPATYKRKSGAKLIYEKGEPQDFNHVRAVSAWRLTKSGFISYWAQRYQNTESFKGKEKGNRWENWMIFITNKDTGETTTRGCVVNPTNFTVHLPDIGLIIKPTTDNGGWVGNPEKVKKMIERRR